MVFKSLDDAGCLCNDGPNQIPKADGCCVTTAPTTMDIEVGGVMRR